MYLIQKCAPRSHRELLAWQQRMEASRREHLFTLAAAAKSHRVALITACRTSKLCHFVDCARPGGVRAHTRANGCHPARLYSVYARSVYCLMPFGDTPSRRAIFDALITGCIPVVYHRWSFHWPWHVPNRSAAALLVPTPAPWARTPRLDARVRDAIGGLLGWRTAGPMGPPEEIANKSQTLDNAFPPKNSK